MLRRFPCRFLAKDSIQNAGQVGEKTTEFLLQQLYPDAIIKRVGHQQDTCDILCTFDSHVDPKTLLIECKNCMQTAVNASLQAVALDKFVDNVTNNTKYDGGVLVVSPKQSLPDGYKDSSGQKKRWFDGNKFREHENLFVCKRESVEMKRVIDTALLLIRAKENFNLGAEKSQRVLQDHRDFICNFANSMNPKLQSLCGVTKQFHDDFNSLTAFAVNHQIDISPFPPLKSLMK